MARPEHENVSKYGYREYIIRGVNCIDWYYPMWVWEYVDSVGVGGEWRGQWKQNKDWKDGGT